jgi:hypothetical protein
MLILFSTKSPKMYDGEKTASSTNVAWKNDYLQKTETGSMFITLY